MQIKHFHHKFTKWRLSLLKSLLLQLFISLISLPFLISWGLPISIVSIFTTLLFGPFLTVFLLISSFIFFCELLHLPNSLFIWLLEIITTIWLSILNVNQQWWLIGFTKPPLIFLFCIVIFTLALLHSKHIKSIQIRTTSLLLLFILICFILKFFPYQHKTIEKISYNKKEITLINHNNYLICIDHGTLSARPSFESFIVYTLIPDIIQKTGKMSIEHFIIHTINKRTFDALAFLTTKITIKNIYLPWWTGKIPLFAWSSYVKLKKAITLSGGKIIPISKKRFLFNDTNSFLFIEPDTTKNIHYYDATYPLLSIQGIINNDNLIIQKKEKNE